MFQLKQETQNQNQPGSGNHGQDNQQMLMNYSRGKGFTLTAMKQNRSQLSPQGKDDSAITSLQSKVLVKRWDLAWTRTMVNQVRPGMAVDSAQWSFALTVPKQQFIRNLRLNYKISGQETGSQVSINTPATTTTALSSSLINSDQDGITKELKLEAEPFWKEHPFSLSYLTRDNNNNKTSTTSQSTIRFLMDLPFVGESRLELTWEDGMQEQRSFNPGAAPTLTRTPTNSLEILLKGNLSERWQLRGGYRKQSGGGATTTLGQSSAGEQWSIEGSTDW